MITAKPWRCMKCESEQYESGEMRVSGGFWSRMFDVQNKKFSTISCMACGHTEIYKRTSSTAGNILDFLTG